MEASRVDGVYFEAFGRGFPLILGYPIVASMMPEDPGGVVRKEYIDRLTDRYRVIVMDYPDQGPDVGRSRRIGGAELTAQRVCEDILGVADAAGFDRFAWWGYSWGGVIGLQLATRSDRVAALVCGGWPPLGAPYAETLRIARAVAAGPPSDFPLPPEQFVTFYQSVESWPEADAIRGIHCPRLAFAGSEDELEVHGIPVRIGATLSQRRGELERQGWQVVEIAGRDHTIYMDPGMVIPMVRSFLDRVV